MSGAKQLATANGVWFVVTNLDVFEVPVPVLVVAGLVRPTAQLSAVVSIPAVYVQHLVHVISLHDPVAVDAPQLLAITHLAYNNFTDYL